MAGALVGVAAHDDPADGGVADHQPDVHADLALEGVEVLGGRAPRPRHALAERLEGHALDPGQHPHEVLAVGGVVGQRGDGEAAVAGEHGGDAVQRRRREGAVPEDLGVEVGVDVDEARCDDLAGGVDGALGVAVDLADGDDAAVLDADVGAAARCAGAVDDVAAPDDQIEHGTLPWVCLVVGTTSRRRPGGAARPSPLRPW